MITEALIVASAILAAPLLRAVVGAGIDMYMFQRTRVPVGEKFERPLVFEFADRVRMLI